jgi:regulator of protease activity HflC (stomatin/prohibitin superfamily)
MFITVHSGEAGVLYKRFFIGTVVDHVFPEGLHVILPWNKMYVYDIRFQTVLQELNVLTNKGLPVHLKLAIRFRPKREMVALLHQRVGPDYLNRVIIPQVESVLRTGIGRYDPEDIYTNKEGVLTKILDEALEQVGQRWVQVDDIIIRSVVLPELLVTAIEQKLVYKQQYLAYQFRLAAEEQEAKRKRIEATGIKSYQSIVSETLNPQLIQWQGVQATLNLATSENAKVVVIGAGKEGLPIILGGQQ